MSSIHEHLLAGGIVLSIGYASGIYDPQYENEALIGAVFLLGNILPDVGNIFYPLVAMQRKRKINILKSESWDSRHISQIDKICTWSHLYKWTHSIFLYIAIFIIVYTSTSDNYAVYAVLSGCFLHIIMDIPTHRDTWILWPVKPMRFGIDWWQCYPFNQNWWHYTTLGLTPWVPIWLTYWLI